MQIPGMVDGGDKCCVFVDLLSAVLYFLFSPPHYENSSGLVISGTRGTLLEKRGQTDVETFLALCVV